MPKVSKKHMRLLNASLFACVILVFGMGLVTTTHNSSSPVSKKSQTASKVAQPNQTALLKLNQNHGHIPLYFEPNEGQFDPQVKFLSRGSGYSLFITPAEAVFVLKRGEGKNLPQRLRDPAKGFGAKEPIKPNNPDVLRLRLEGGNRLAEFAGMEKTEGKSNYFIGNDRSKWHTNIPNYTKVKMREVYPGVDMVYYGAQRKLEYDFEVKPGVDPNVIGLSYEGAKNAEVDGQGDLIFHMDKGDVAFKAPVVYQKRMKNGEWTIENEKIEGHYSLKPDGKIGFEMGNYDKTLPLVIDPVLDYSTYLGGNIIDGMNLIAVDAAGNAYVAGTSDGNFPVTPGAYQSAFSSHLINMVVSKIDPTGSTLLYATYLGPAEGTPTGIAVNGAGNAFIMANAPTGFPTTTGSYETASSGGGPAVAELNPNGSFLVYSTYLGGGEARRAGSP